MGQYYKLTTVSQDIMKVVQSNHSFSSKYNEVLVEYYEGRYAYTESTVDKVVGAGHKDRQRDGA